MQRRLPYNTSPLDISMQIRIITDNPFGSPVPLAAVEDYRLIHSSGEETVVPGIGITVPEVKIFEYIRLK